jgi:hypothetical protein
MLSRKFYMPYNETPTTIGILMDDINETSDKNFAQKTFKTTSDISTLIGIGMAAYGLGRLAYEGGKFGITAIRTRRNKTED